MTRRFIQLGAVYAAGFVTAVAATEHARRRMLRCAHPTALSTVDLSRFGAQLRQHPETAGDYRASLTAVDREAMRRVEALDC